MSDLISRQAVELRINEFLTNETYTEGMLRDDIHNLPSAQKRGEWEEIETISNVYDLVGLKTWASKMRCNQCGFTTYAIEGRFAQYNFCPHCGARMVRGEEDENTFSFTLESPLTAEQINLITDAEFEHTDRIWFDTPKGKHVEFVKAQQWIPCSERLPEKEVDVLCCRDNKTMAIRR